MSSWLALETKPLLSDCPPPWAETSAVVPRPREQMGHIASRIFRRCFKDESGLTAYKTGSPMFGGRSPFLFNVCLLELSKINFQGKHHSWFFNQPVQWGLLCLAIPLDPHLLHLHCLTEADHMGQFQSLDQGVVDDVSELHLVAETSRN